MEQHTFKKKRAALLELAQDMPMANCNLLKLIIKETDGNVNAFSKKIGVSQQLLDFALKPDKDGFYRNFPSVQKAVIETFSLEPDWFTKEHEDIDAVFQDAFPSSKKNTQSNKAVEEMTEIIASLTSQLKKQTEINERYSLMLEKLMNKLIGNEDNK